MIQLQLPQFEIVKTAVTNPVFWKWFPWVALIAVCAAWYLTSRDTDNVSSYLADINRAHQVEMEEINRIRETERLEYIANAEVLQRQLAGITADYETRLQEIERRKEQRTVTIVREYSGKPDELTALVAKEFGFTIQSAASR
jgi:hypothetical protein